MSSSPQVFNSDYVNGLRRGDPAIEAHFVDYFDPILARTLRGKVRSADQAKDLQQETFLRVLAAVRSGREVRKPERFEIFVIGVCRNVVRETYREQYRCVALSTLETEPVADLPSAYALVLAKETSGNVNHTISQLDSNDQNVLKAMFLDGHNKEEICCRLGVSRSYLRVLLCRAKKRYRSHSSASGRQPKVFRKGTGSGMDERTASRMMGRSENRTIGKPAAVVHKDNHCGPGPAMLV